VRKGSKAGYAVQTFHKDQQRILGNKACNDYKVTTGFLFDFYYDLNKTIIRDQYEYKIGSRGGYLRISVSKRGKVFWLWDRNTEYCKLSRKRLWDFKPTVGWQNPVEIGQRGLKKWLWDSNNDPKKEKYIVFPRSHKTFK
jgi:hypothetical protein